MQGGGDLRGSAATLIFYGEKDPEGEKSTKFYFNDLMDADIKRPVGSDPKKLAKEEMKSNSRIFVEKGAKEKGAELLGKNNTPKVEDTIKAFIDKIESDRKRLASIGPQVRQALPHLASAAFGIQIVKNRTGFTLPVRLLLEIEAERREVVQVALLVAGAGVAVIAFEDADTEEQARRRIDGAFVSRFRIRSRNSPKPLSTDG